jgi:RimJ/RimL family protein N-acetyltransferase
MLTGTSILLRAPREDDLARLVEWRNDVALQTQLLTIARPNTPHRVREWLARRLDDPASAFFIIADREQGLAQGYIQAVRIDFTHGTGELGICLQPSAQGKGFASQSIQLLEGYLSDRLRLRKLILHTLSANARAVRFYEKHSYRRVGTLTENFYADGHWHDVIIMEKFLRVREAAA